MILLRHKSSERSKKREKKQLCAGRWILDRPKKNQPLPLRCKYGNNIPHVGSKLLMYSVCIKLPCPLSRVDILEERSWWRLLWSKGLGQVATAPQETDDLLRCSKVAAYVPHWLFTLLQVHRCSCWTFIESNRTNCHRRSRCNISTHCQVPQMFFFFLLFTAANNVHSLFEMVIFSGRCVCMCVRWQRSTSSKPLAGVDRPTIWINSSRYNATAASPLFALMEPIYYCQPLGGPRNCRCW